MLEVILLIQAVLIGLLLVAVAALLAKIRGRQVDAENFRTNAMHHAMLRQSDLADLAVAILGNQLPSPPKPPGDND